MDIWEAIDRTAERTVENRKFWGQALRQRRTEFTDIYGIPLYSETDSAKTFKYHIQISQDMEYYERYQFKLSVTAEGDIDPDLFKFEMTDADTLENGDYTWIDLSEYLEEQVGIWPNKSGYYPTEYADDEGDFYDLLDVGCLLTAEGKEEEREMLLGAGSKLIRIKSPTPCSVILIPFIKYSTINR